MAALGAVLLIVQMTAAAVLAAPGVTPSSVTATVLPGGSTTVDKTVETPPIPADPDVIFLADTTSSMSGAIGNVQANASTIISGVLADAPSAQFGVAHYTDQNCPNPFVLDQAITANTANVITALNGLTTPQNDCNADAAEDYINAIYQLATDPAVGLRSGSTPIVILFGDSSSHDPSVGTSLATAISAAQAAGMRVIGVNVPGTSGFLFNGLDNAGQATAFASATGGLFLNAPTVGEISDTIIAGLGNLPVTITPDVTCDPGLSVSITPASQTVVSGDSTTWSEQISVDPGNPGGVTLQCTVNWLLDGVLTGPEFVQHVTIEIPGADLSIVKTGPALVTENEQFSYDLTVTNDGPADATDVVIVDPLPTNATFVSADAGCTEAAGTVTCDIGALAAGDSVTRSITVVAGSAGGDLTNTATVSAFNTDPDPSDNTSTVVTTLNHDPTCTEVTAGDDLWPPNHKFVLRTLTGAFDIDGDAVVTTVLEVTQDEPLDELGDGKTTPDARPGAAGDQVELRAERSGRGDGRVYRISFKVEDGLGGECTGTALLGVPHDQRGDPAVDSGAVYVDFPVVAMTSSTDATSDHPSTKRADHPAATAKPPKAQPSHEAKPKPKTSAEPKASAEPTPSPEPTTGADSDTHGAGKSDPGGRGQSDQDHGHGNGKSGSGKAP
jgi:uncharacterized repeat protein (TIGR01451 family)